MRKQRPSNSLLNNDIHPPSNTDAMEMTMISSNLSSPAIKSSKKKGGVKNTKKSKSLRQPLTSSLLSPSSTTSSSSSSATDSNLDAPSSFGITIHHDPEIFIAAKKHSEFEMDDNHHSSLCCVPSCFGAKSHRNNLSLEQFLDILQDEWSTEQVLHSFTKHHSDPRIIHLDDAFVSLSTFAGDPYHGVSVPREIWQIVVGFELGSVERQIRRRYYHWVWKQRYAMHWIPFCFGTLQSLGIFVVLFYLFLSGSSLHDATDLGAADITESDIDTDTDTDDDTESLHHDDFEENGWSSWSGDDIKILGATVAVVAAVIQIIGALTTYLLARYRYSAKLKRFKEIILLDAVSESAVDRDCALQIESNDNNDDDGNENGNGDDGDGDNDDDKEMMHYEATKDLPNVEIAFDIDRVPEHYRHILVSKESKPRRARSYDDVESDSDSDRDRDHNGDDNDGDDGDDEMDSDLRERQRQKRLSLMMGMKVDDGDDEVDDFGAPSSVEEMALIQSDWECFIGFQRWMNVPSLVVTDNLKEPALICLVLHKYLFVLCASTTVFGSKLSEFESLIPIILLLFSSSFLSLIVLDRISAKRALLYMASMVCCCGFTIGLFTGILFLLSFLFDDHSTSWIDTTTTTTTPSPSIEGGGDGIMTTASNVVNIGTTTSAASSSIQSTAIWITDFFYPFLSVILCFNTVRRIRNGFEHNVPEIKYTLWSHSCFVAVIMIFATNSATWSNAEVKAIFLFVVVYMGYLWAQMRVHHAVTKLSKIEYANKYLDGSKWVKTQLMWSWLGQISGKF